MAGLENSFDAGWQRILCVFVCVCVCTLLLHIFGDVGLWDHLTVKQLGGRILG